MASLSTGYIYVGAAGGGIIILSCFLFDAAAFPFFDFLLCDKVELDPWDYSFELFCYYCSYSFKAFCVIDDLIV